MSTNCFMWKRMSFIGCPMILLWKRRRNQRQEIDTIFLQDILRKYDSSGDVKTSSAQLSNDGNNRMYEH